MDFILIDIYLYFVTGGTLILERSDVYTFTGEESHNLHKF